MIIFLKHVRIAFPELHSPKPFQGQPDSKPRYSATLLVERGSENDRLIKETIQKAAEAEWASKTKEILASIEGRPKDYCYCPGDLKEYDGYAGKMALSVSRNPEKDGPPKVIGRNLEVLTALDGKPYSGCYVNAKVDIWAQKNKYGNGIRATVVVVQFVADGEAFRGAGPATAEGFEVIPDNANDLI